MKNWSHITRTVYHMNFHCFSVLIYKKGILSYTCFAFFHKIYSVVHEVFSICFSAFRFKNVTLPRELLLVESTTTTTTNMMKSKIPRCTKYKRKFYFPLQYWSNFFFAQTAISKKCHLIILPCCQVSAKTGILCIKTSASLKPSGL